MKLSVGCEHDKGGYASLNVGSRRVNSTLDLSPWFGWSPISLCVEVVEIALHWHKLMIYSEPYKECGNDTECVECCHKTFVLQHPIEVTTISLENKRAHDLNRGSLHA